MSALSYFHILSISNPMGLAVSKTASSLLAFRWSGRRFFLYGKSGSGFVPLLLVGHVTAEFIRRSDQWARLPGFGGTQLGEDAIKVVTRFARQVVFHLPEFIKKRIRLHRNSQYEPKLSLLRECLGA